jgi:hypothetical protein
MRLGPKGAVGHARSGPHIIAGNTREGEESDDEAESFELTGAMRAASSRRVLRGGTYVHLDQLNVERHKFEILVKMSNAVGKRALPQRGATCSPLLLIKLARVCDRSRA